MQFLTGHGNFRANLNGFRFRLVDCPECGWCDVLCLLWKCRRFEKERREFLSGDVGEDVRLGLREAMENERSSSKLFHIMKRIARRKEMQEQRSRAENSWVGAGGDNLCLIGWQGGVSLLV